MPSPFPGMDPYLESPHIWPDFHHALAGTIRAQLNRSVPEPYYARLEMRPEVGIVDEADDGRHIVPNVTVVRVPGPVPEHEEQVAVLELPRTQASESLEVSVTSEPFRHLFVEIRDPTDGHKLITLIEIVSPSNKRPGQDRRAYQKKQREVLESDASLVELDLLRRGERLPANAQLAQIIDKLDPSPHYLVSVNRSWTRVGETMGCQIFSTRLRHILPCVPVPLRREEPEVLLDLQVAFNRSYDEGPYRRGAVDYSRPPRIPLDADDVVWAAELLRRQGFTGSVPEV